MAERRESDANEKRLKLIKNIVFKNRHAVAVIYEDSERPKEENREENKAEA